MQVWAEVFHPSCRRRSERRPTRVTGTFGQVHERIVVDVTDLSLEGVRLSTPVALLPGTHIWLKLPRLASREAVVIWAEGMECGCEFADPLHPMTFDVLTRRRAGGRELSPERSGIRKKDP
jgi:hypothetical protein